MAIEAALGLVIRGTDWSETSRITTLFTREFGKIRALAKGGRRLRSNFEVAFDLLTCCQIMVIRKHTGGLDLLTEAQVAERFPALRKDLTSLNVGYYIAELLAEGTEDYDPHPALFDTALSILRSLGSEGSDRLGLVSHFELVWLKELGYSPRLDTCAICGAGVEAEGAASFSSSAGGAICGGCQSGVRDLQRLGADTWRTLRHLAGGGRELLPGSRRDVRRILGQTVSYTLGRRPRLLAYVDSP